MTDRLFSAPRGIARRFRLRWSVEGGYRQLLTIALPLILSNGAYAIQQFVDRMFLAWFSPSAVAATTPAGILNFMIVSLFINTAGYVGTFVAQYHGAGRDNRIGSAIWQGIYLSLAGAALLLPLVPAAPAIFGVIGHGGLVEVYEVSYFRVLTTGAVFVILNAALTSFYSGLGKTWPVLWILLASTAVNVVLDYLLIFGRAGLPELGVTGAATATVIAGAVATTIFAICILARRDRRQYGLHDARLDLRLLVRVIRYGLPSGLQIMIDMSGFTVFILLVGRLGTESLAATNLALNINMLAFMPVIGLGIAVSVLVGQHIGDGRVDRAEYSTYSGVHVALGYMCFIGATYILFPDLFLLPYMLNADPNEFHGIEQTARTLLRFVAVYSLFDALTLTFSSAIKGAGDTRFVVLVIAGLSLCVLTVPTAVMLLVLGWGMYAAWTAATVYISVLGIVFLLRFRHGAWKRMSVMEPEM
ncbi:MAG TPA: MATE family efflux transporter [Spirochaetia bacterium]|nr:MATE family efflux transporter [Spirochaetia bacterium]